MGMKKLKAVWFEIVQAEMGKLFNTQNAEIKILSDLFNKIR
jgi:hypothetical protein